MPTVISLFSVAYIFYPIDIALLIHSPVIGLFLSAYIRLSEELFFDWEIVPKLADPLSYLFQNG